MTEIPAWLKSQRSVPVKDDPARWPRDVEKAFDEYAAHRPLGGDYASPVQIDHGNKIKIRMPNDYVVKDDVSKLSYGDLVNKVEASLKALPPLTIEEITAAAINVKKRSDCFIDNLLFPPSSRCFYFIPWQRFINRWKCRAQRLPDAWAVLMGRKFATED